MDTEVRYVQIRNMDVVNGEGLGCAVFFQGCPFHCKNCFNQETWDMDGGKIWTEDTTREVLNVIEPLHIKRISFLGGEPMLERNRELLNDLLYMIKLRRPDMRVWIYTGFLYEDLLSGEGALLVEEILWNVDVLVDGTFKEDLKNFKLKFRGSSNQRIIDVQQSLKEGQVVCFDKYMELRD